MDSQTAFMRNIRQSLGLAPDTERPKRLFPALFAKADTALILQDIENRTTEQQNELVEILQANALALGVNISIAGSHDEAAAIVVDLVRTKNPEFTHTKHIVHHDHPDLATLQLWKRFSREGITVHTSFSADQQLREKTIASFIGITAADIGVADSATFIQLTQPGRPRSTSLVPSIHIAFLKKEHLVADLREAYALLREKERLDSFVFITGPSKTADIEAQMVHGAHGPREVHLIVLSPPPIEKDVRETQNLQHTEEQQPNS
ncbi:MAG: lactate utilization protein [Proteobacteria bacterium]|nr:lactate utilization protein [Pseudomonadota bacterium]